MLPLFPFPLPLPFPLACSMNTLSAAPLLQTTQQRNGWIWKFPCFHFQPALLAFTTSDRPNSVSHSYPSWRTFHLSRLLNSGLKSSSIPPFQSNFIHHFPSSWSLPFIMIGRRQPFPSYNQWTVQDTCHSNPLHLIHITMTCAHHCQSVLNNLPLRKAALVVLLQLLLTRQALLLAGPLHVITPSYLVYSLTVLS